MAHVWTGSPTSKEVSWRSWKQAQEKENQRREREALKEAKPNELNQQKTAKDAEVVFKATEMCQAQFETGKN